MKKVRMCRVGLTCLNMLIVDIYLSQPFLNCFFINSSLIEIDLTANLIIQHRITLQKSSISIELYYKYSKVPSNTRIFSTDYYLYCSLNDRKLFCFRRSLFSVILFLFDIMSNCNCWNVIQSSNCIFVMKLGINLNIMIVIGISDLQNA